MRQWLYSGSTIPFQRDDPRDQRRADEKDIVERERQS